MLNYCVTSLQNFSSCQTNILYPLTTHNIPLPLAPDNHHSTFGFYEFDCSRHLM